MADRRSSHDDVAPKLPNMTGSVPKEEPHYEASDHTGRSLEMKGELHSRETHDESREHQAREHEMKAEQQHDERSTAHIDPQAPPSVQMSSMQSAERAKPPKLEEPWIEVIPGVFLLQLSIGSLVYFRENLVFVANLDKSHFNAVLSTP